MNIKAKYSSYGFRGKYWEAGEIAENVTPKELELPEMKHFEAIGGAKNIPVAPNKPETPLKSVSLFEANLKAQLELKTVPELKAILDAANVKYKSNAGKNDLIALILDSKISISDEPITPDDNKTNPLLNLTLDELKNLAAEKEIEFDPEISQEDLVKLLSQQE